MSLRENKGFHPILTQDQPHIFIDSCMQAWPDADFPNAHRHGVTAFAVTTWYPPEFSVDQALESLMSLHLVIRQHDNIVLAEKADDIRNAKRDGKAAFILHAQDGSFIGKSLHRIEAFYRLGLRMLIPSYNVSNQICDGCLDRTDSGLTRFGELVVEECNRLGLLLDCSHIGRQASLDIIERSENPVVFSHSNPNKLSDSPRNIDDEQILAVTNRGGMVGLAPFGPLVMKKDGTHWPTLSEFVEHVDYVVQLTGSSENIGIGTDMSLGTYAHLVADPWGEPKLKGTNPRYEEYVTSDRRSPKRALDGFNCYPEVVNFIEELTKRGYSDTDVGNILGNNYLRLFDKVWK